MTTENTYNGWSNYETWNAKLWIDNDQGSQEYWQDRAEACLQDAIDNEESDVRQAAAESLAADLESSHDEGMPEVSGVYADLLQAASGAIDWREIADNMLSGIDVYSAGWNMPGYMPDNTPELFLDADDARQYIIDQIEQHEEEVAEESVAEMLCAAAEDVNLMRGELGITVAGYHYFITKV